MLLAAQQSHNPAPILEDWYETAYGEKRHDPIECSVMVGTGLQRAVGDGEALLP